MTPLLIAAIVALTNECGCVEVDTSGAHILSYVPAGGHEVLFRPSADRCPGQWYHGGIPVCWPWFSRYGDPGSCMHGLARLLDWEVVLRRDATRESRLRLRLKSDERSARHFDGAFELDYEIVLAETLSMNLTMRNTGAKRFAVTTGFHPYFRIGELTAAAVRTPEGTIRCVPGVDGGRPFADGSCTLADGEREIRLTTWGNRKLVIWNPGEGRVQGLGPEDWRHFVCVEPTIVPRMEGLWLEPMATYEIGMSIRLTGLRDQSKACSPVRGN